MVRFQKIWKNFVLILQGNNIHCQQRKLSRFSRAISSSLVMLTAGPRHQFSRWRRSKRRLSVCSVSRSPDQWLQCSVSFVHGLKNTCVSFKPCIKLTLHCNHSSGHLQTENKESCLLLRRHLGNCSRSPAVSMTSELLIAREKSGQFPLPVQGRSQFCYRLLKPHHFLNTLYFHSFNFLSVFFFIPFSLYNFVSLAVYYNRISPYLHMVSHNITKELEVVH
jgi:hypothetical protein